MKKQNQVSGITSRSSKIGRLCVSFFVVFVASFLTQSVFGQGTTGALRGQVLDPSGYVVPSAQVTATNQDTGVTLKVTTTSAGTYNLPSVLPGLYTVAVEAKGFKLTTKKAVPVVANQDNVADFNLEIGAVTETMEVVAGAVEIQTISSSLGNNFASTDVENLPQAPGTLNGSVLNLAILSPNVIAQPGGTTGIGGSVGGTRPRANNFTVDGVDDNNLGVTGNNSTVIPDAVAQFSLITNQFSAEYGHSAGGQFSIITKTGTNNWHGSGEWYNQNRTYNSLDNLTKAGIASQTISGQPPFDNNRFGGTMGGPIIKNKLFIFGAYEYTYLHGQGTATAFTGPTAAGMAILKADAVNSTILGLLDNFPIAASADVPLANWALVNDTPIPTGNITIFSPNFQREHDAVFNADYTWGKHQLGARFLWNQASFIFPVNSTQSQFNQNEQMHNRKIALTDVWSINSHLSNDLRVQYSFFFQGFLNPCGSACPPDVTIYDLFSAVTIGPGDVQTQKQNTYQIADSFTWTRGKHSFKFGGQYNHFIYPQFFLPRSFGDNQYDAANVFINDLNPELTNAGRTLRNAGTGSFLGTQSAFYVFAQDDFKVTPRLTLNLGVRYEYWTNPLGASTQTLNAVSNVPGVITFGDPKTDKNNIAPRIGFAYDPTGSGKTAIRGGFGIAYDVKFQNFASITLPPQLQSELNPVSACTLTPLPSWCATNTGFLAGGGLPATYIPPATQAEARSLTTSYIDDTVLPKILTWSLGVQREVYSNASIEVRYLGTRGLELPVQYRRNHISAFDAGISPLPTFFKASDIPTSWTASTPTDAAFNAFDSNTYSQYGFNANITADPPLGSSIYHAGSINYIQRSHYGVTLNANYTYAHTIDNSTNEFFTSLLNPRRAQDSNRLNEDRGNSDLDVRHKFALSLFYQVPDIKSDNRFMKAVVNGVEIGSTFLAQSGQPVTLQSGNAGIDSNGNGDTAGDRASVNPFNSGSAGTDVYAVCELPGGAIGLSSAGVAAGGACPSSAIGYTPVDTTAKYMITGPGARANLARNSFRSPGFGVLSLAVAKNFHFTEAKSLQVKADLYNVLNHANYALSNGNVFSNAGVTTATSTPGYAVPTDSNFLNAFNLFSGGIRSMTLSLKFLF